MAVAPQRWPRRCYARGVLRTAVLVSIASVCVSCKTTPPVDPLGHGASTLPPGERLPRRVATTPEGRLGELVHARVTIERSLAAPGGSVALFGWNRLEAALAERAAEGHDVTTELETAQRECNEERAALDPEEREYLDSDYQSCEELAGSIVVGDEQLTPDCQALGVAWLDGAGRVLDTEELDGPCLSGVRSLEAYDVTPEARDELLLLATFDTLGLLNRGGFGATQSTTRLYVLALEDDGEESVLIEQLVVDLDIENDGGNCGSGFRRSVSIVEPGVLEVFSQAWDDCANEGCVTAEEAAEIEATEDMDMEPPPLCREEPVIGDRTIWQPETHEWGAFEPFEHEGKVLPDGIMK